MKNILFFILVLCAFQTAIARNNVVTRTEITANVSFEGLSTTADEIYDVPTGSKFYLDSIIIIYANTLTNVSVCSVRDNGTIKVPFIAKQTISGQESGYGIITQTFPTPIEFTDSVEIISANASGVNVSVTISGILETPGV